MNDITITSHALERFIQRAKKTLGSKPKNPEAAIRKLLKLAKLEKVPTIRKVKKLIKHKKDAIYLVNQGWRFVLSEDGSILITVERVNPDQN